MRGRSIDSKHPFPCSIFEALHRLPLWEATLSQPIAVSGEEQTLKSLVLDIGIELVAMMARQAMFWWFCYWPTLVTLFHSLMVTWGVPRLTGSTIIINTPLGLSSSKENAVSETFGAEAVVALRIYSAASKYRTDMASPALLHMFMILTSSLFNMKNLFKDNKTIVVSRTHVFYEFWWTLSQRMRNLEHRRGSLLKKLHRAQRISKRKNLQSFRRW